MTVLSYGLDLAYLGILSAHEEANTSELLDMKDGYTFFRFLQKFISLTEDEFNKEIRPVLKERIFEKKQMLTETGEVEDYFNFIVQETSFLITGFI